MIRAIVITAFAAWLIGAAAYVATPSTGPVCITVPMLSNYDGDTATVQMTLIGSYNGQAVVIGHKASKKKSPNRDRWPVRMRGFDTPEMRGGCPESKALAKKARDQVAQMAADAGGHIEICNPVFAGAARDRIVADVLIAGEPLATTLPALGLARPHEGGEARKPWCGVQ